MTKTNLGHTETRYEEKNMTFKLNKHTKPGLRTAENVPEAKILRIAKTQLKG